MQFEVAVIKVFTPSGDGTRVEDSRAVDER